MYLSIKWSKSNQFRDRVQVITLPRLKSSILCPVRALKQAMALYNPAPHDPLFQIFSAGRWSVLIDSRIREVLATLNVKLGFPSNKYTFHTFHRSGATSAYNSNASLQSSKKHGSWSSDCVWTYIQENESSDKEIAQTFAPIV